MKFDIEKVNEKLRIFWKHNKNKLHYFLNGKEVFPKDIPACSFNLVECEFSEEYNFEANVLHIQITLDSTQKPYMAKFFIKVAPDTFLASEIPGEKIVGVYKNRVDLYTR